MAANARPPRRRRRVKLSRIASETAQYAALTIAAVVILAPVYITVVYSLQPVDKIFAYPPHLYVTDPQWDTYRRAFETGSLGRYLVNSFIVSVAITAGQVVTSVLAAYAFAFLRFPFRNQIFIIFLASLMVPWEVTIIPNYQTISTLGWLDSYQGLIVPFLATAFGTFLLRQAFLTVPRDLRDAAAMDGYGHIGFMLQVAVPLSRAAVGALAVFSFLLAWNQYLWPLLITNEDSHRTVQIGLKALVSSNIDEFNLVMAGTVIAAAPILALLVLFQKQLIRGLTSGAIKG
jgi:ABC-type glycerol-3-phosphate transport system permease component